MSSKLHTLAVKWATTMDDKIGSQLVDESMKFLNSVNYAVLNSVSEIDVEQLKVSAITDVLLFITPTMLNENSYESILGNYFYQSILRHLKLYKNRHIPKEMSFFAIVYDQYIWQL